MTFKKFFILILILKNGSSFCVINNSCRSIAAFNYEDTSNSAFAQTNIGPGSRACCNPTSSGCYFGDSEQGSYPAENFIVRIKCDGNDSDGQKVSGCTRCNFVVDSSRLITVTEEETGVIRAVVACQGARIPNISKPRKDPGHDELRKGGRQAFSC